MTTTFLASLRLVLFILAAGVAAPGFAQADPDENVCVQKGGKLLCVKPIIGQWEYSHARCNGRFPSANEDTAAVEGGAMYYSGCGGDQVMGTPGPWGTTELPMGGACGSYALYPHRILGVEDVNVKSVPFTFCFGTPYPPSQESLAVYRQRTVGCPENFYAIENGTEEGFCAPTLSPKNIPCQTCLNAVGNPIDVGVRNKKQVEVDYAPAGTILTFSRQYNSLQDLLTNRMGAKWVHQYDRRLTLTAANPNVVFSHRANGGTYTHWKSAGVWTHDGDVNDRLVPVLDGAGATIGWQLTLADDSVERYSAAGLLLSHTLANGQSITFTYSDAGTSSSVAPAPGLLIGATDSFGKSLAWTYDAASRIATMQDPAGNTYTYAYDANNNLASVTYPDGKVRSYVYNESSHIAAGLSFPHHLTGIVDENGARFATFGYDTDGTAISTEHAGANYKYSLATAPYSQTAVTDPLGTVRYYSAVSVKGVYKITQISEPCPGVSACSYTRTHQYDANGNISNDYDANGNVTAYTYDLARNLMLSRTEAYGSSPSLARQTTYTWDATRRLPATVTEPTASGNKVTTFTYDANSNLLTKVVAVGGLTRTWTWTYDAYGRVLTATDPRNNTTTSTYYANSSGQGYKRAMLNTITNAAGHVVTITNYNAYGQPLAITDPNGLVTTLTYDLRLRLKSRTVGTEVTQYDYDGVGQLSKITLPDGSYLQYTYDAAHRLTQIQDSLGNRVSYTLDGMGNRLKEDYADPSNVLARTRSRVYDALNRLQQDIGGATPASQVMQYVYDGNGNATGVTDPLSRVTTQSYDALNRLMKVVDPFNSTAAPTKYEYDVEDNLTKVTDPKNLDTTYSYNGFNELLTQVSPDTGTTTFTYDAGGNMLTKVDARSVTATYTYDALNRVATINYPAYGSDPAEVVTYTYDSCTNGKGLLCSFTDKTGTTTYSYNTLGRLTGKSQAVGSVTQSIGYRYNSNGQMTGVTYPSGAAIGYGYTNNRVTSVTINGKTVLAGADYEPFGPVGQWKWGNGTAQVPNEHVRYFDLDGRNVKIDSTAGLEPTMIVYDAASRSTDIQKLNAANAVDPAKSNTYGYDALDRLTTVTPNSGNPNPARGFTYDGVGNRLTATVAGATTNYGYGSSSHRLNSLTGATSLSYAYDTVGNRTNDGTAVWTYGGNNRPIQVSVGGTVTTILINALGQRVKKTTGGTGTRFMYDEAGRLIGEYTDGGTRITETVWFNDMPVAVMK